MTTDYIIPTAIDLREIEQDLLPRLTEQRPIFDFFPIVTSDDSVVAWEQEDNYVGLQQLRGINGAPQQVKRTGGSRYTMTPGVYGEFTVIDENELTRRRRYGSVDQSIDISDLVAKDQRHLLNRRLDRIELIGWTLVTTGTFSVSTPTGAVAHTDSYSIQTYSAAVPWSTSATATPLADLRAVQLLARGHSVRFDQTCKLYVNQKQANRLFANTNSADLYGRRTAGLGTFNSPGQINELFAGDGLPQIVVYDKGYLDESGTFQNFIPDGKAIVIGARESGSPVGEYQLTRNANNDGLAPGAYMRVVDTATTGGVPRSIQVHDGHNGGPAMLFPSAVVVMSV
jgi:hypothetical protein